MAASGYMQPSGAILESMHAPSPPVPHLAPTADRMILATQQKYPSIAHVATPYLKLAGVRIESNHNRRNTPDGHGIRKYASQFDLHIDGTAVPIALPDDARATEPLWTVDGRYFAFSNVTPSSVDIYIGNGQTGAVSRVDARLNPVLQDELRWMPDQKTLLVKLVIDGDPPAEPSVPWGPTVQETDGKKGQSSTYEARDTLKNKHDEALFDYYATSQLAFIDAESMSVRHFGKPDLYSYLQASPDGKYLLVESIHKPYSYLTAWRRFPYTVSVWTLSDLTSVTVASLPLADRVPIRGVPVGPRNVLWRPNAPAMLTWVEALDGGDWAVDVPHRDQVMMLNAPFTAPVEVARTEYRFGGFKWGAEPSFAVMAEYDINKQWQRSYVIDIDKDARRLLTDISMNEKYKHPGEIVTRRASNGTRLIYQVDDTIFFAGGGASPAGDRPFLDRLDLESLQPTRLFRSSASTHEKFLMFVDANTFLTARQAPDEPPNVIQHKLQSQASAPEGEAVFTTTSTAITHIPNPTPLISQIGKRIVTYKRNDGVDLSFNLHTPPGYVEGTRIPTILYAYPRDFADKSQAGQVSGSQALFTRVRKHQFLLLAGYAIIENAAFPIVGDPKKAYDTYLEQLVANAEAAVAKAVELGVADPDRIGVTGHSHGALMAANLLAHSSLFKAAVATSGSYNKTLTPFGFQNERRTVWQAPDVYREASTFFAADQMKRPLLIVHGGDDANPGTTPMQSMNLYSAIRGNGGMAKLVMLPHEPHWYEAKESHEHLVYEMVEWFDRYVKRNGGSHI